MLWLTILGCGDRTEQRPAPATTGSTECATDEHQFEHAVSPILQRDCVTCHVEGGVAGASRNVLWPATTAGHLEHNREVLAPLALEQAEGQSLLVAKLTAAVAHGGGERFSPTDPEAAVFRELVARYEAPGGCSTEPEAPLCDPAVPVPGEQPLRRLTDRQYTNAVFDLTGVRAPIGLFPTTTSGDLYSTWPEANVVSTAGAEGILNAAEFVADTLAAQPRQTTGCDDADEACRLDWAKALAYRAFRRPLSAEDDALVERVLTSDADPAEQIRRTVGFLLQSPLFLYLDGTGTPVEGVEGAAALDDFAVAARLSFYLLETTPSDALLDRAAAGGLDSRAEVLEVAREMVDDPRSTSVFAQFHRDWSHLYRIDTIAKDAAVYPEFGPELVAQMRDELDLFTTEVVWLGDGTLDALLYSSTSWTTPELDALYGTSAAREGDGWERRDLGPDRPGLLTRSAFLTAHAYSATSSPIRRGAFVTHQLLCETMVPPPGIPLELEDATETNTIRDRLAVHRASPSCAGCHDRLDPIGFSFENYGALGEWRDEWENGIPVDATGTLADPDGSFDGVPELLDVLDSGDHVRDCYARQWLAYGLGREPVAEDSCSIEQLETRFAETQGDLRDLMVQVAASDAFRYRKEAP